MNAHWQAPLQQANRIRQARLELRRWVRASHDQASSRQRVAILLIGAPAAVRTLSVYELVSWAWRMSEHEALELVTGADMSPFAKTGQVTLRQRAVLARMLINNEEEPCAPTA